MVVQLDEGDPTHLAGVVLSRQGSVTPGGYDKAGDSPPFAQRVLDTPQQVVRQIPHWLIGVLAAGAIGLLVLAAATNRATNDSSDEVSGLTQPTTGASTPQSEAAGERASGSWAP